MFIEERLMPVSETIITADEHKAYFEEEVISLYKLLVEYRKDSSVISAFESYDATDYWNEIMKEVLLNSVQKKEVKK